MRSALLASSALAWSSSLSSSISSSSEWAEKASRWLTSFRRMVRTTVIAAYILAVLAAGVASTASTSSSKNSIRLSMDGSVLA